MTARKNSVSLNGRPLRRRRRAVLERYAVTTDDGLDMMAMAKSHADAARQWALAYAEQVPTAANCLLVVTRVVIARGKCQEDAVAYRASELLAPRHISMASAKLPRWFHGGDK